jgi:hypothetical protein
MKTFISAIFFSLLLNSVYSETIQTDSLYLGQTPPGNSPKTFNLPVGSGLFASDRIAISKDDKEIYYSEINDWSPTSTMRIKQYVFTDKWTGPFTLFNGFFAPALSISSDTIYMEKIGSDGKLQAFFSTRNNSVWSTPKKMLFGLNKAHYLQASNKNNYFISSIPVKGIGGIDWCKLYINGIDTTVLSLGLPLNTSGNDLDFCVSRDETFMIVAKSSGLSVSYYKNDSSWTNPKNIGPKINFGTGMWGPYISSDNKYLFYTTGTKSDYSDTHVYWVRIDGLIDSLKKTNFTPYLKTTINGQTDSLGHSFSLIIPDSTFFDDDGNNTLSYSATLSSNKTLPKWLLFNAATKTFSGTLDSIGSFSIKVIATDNSKASVSTTFTLKVVENPKNLILQTFKENIQVYPNPTNSKINITLGSLQYKTAIVVITDLFGKLISSDTFHNISSATIDLTGTPRGIYILSLSIDGEKINKKISVEW